MHDGWTFRERGIYQKVGREQYGEASTWVGLDDPNFAIDLLQEPDAISNRVVSARVAFAHFLNSKSPLATGTDARSMLRRSRDLQDKTLREVLVDRPKDFEDARLNQTDMGDGSKQELAEVVERSEMFSDCIAKSAH
jgi:hypothetical protein